MVAAKTEQWKLTVTLVVLVVEVNMRINEKQKNVVGNPISKLVALKLWIGYVLGVIELKVESLNFLEITIIKHHYLNFLSKKGS